MTMTDHERGVEAAIRKAGQVAIDHLIDTCVTYEATNDDLADYLTRIVDACVRAALSALAPQAGDNVEEPVAWRYRGKNWGENYWHYFTKEPSHKEDGEIWQGLYTHPCTSTPVVSQNAPDLEDKGGDGA
ncbi:hypothetical protein ATY75_11950 [Rhizobium sp. N122]|uniref:hypothetical protein n=1 Tax=Rhizobium sp. N122 TaxID=1764272 RepID=UPI000B5A6E0C|nr:hypothetical protein [Rhizobium sp. N122]OWV62533.1 hypothetical protein ATY75_11950 [Rhizobium sp. N122]